jgi:hypothetical protein
MALVQVMFGLLRSCRLGETWKLKVMTLQD